MPEEGEKVGMRGRSAGVEESREECARLAERIRKRGKENDDMWDPRVSVCGGKS